MKFVFSNGSGAINLGTGDMPVSSFTLPFQCDGLFYDDHGNHFFKFLGGGRSMMIDTEIQAVASYLASIPSQPDPTNVWTSTGWQVPVGSLLDAQNSQWNTIKAARDAKLNGGFTFNGGVYDSDPESRANIQGAVQLAQIAIAASQAFSQVWTLADNSTVTLDAPTTIQMGVALGQFIGALYADGVTLRNQINAATTVAQVNAITWT